MNKTQASRLPASGADLLISELFVSLQGEGASVGQPAAFVRLGNCNLSCSYCDTPYTWDSDRYDLKEELSPRSVEDVASWICENAPGRVILTGGEPLLQKRKLERLLALVDERRAPVDPIYCEVETNGTISPGDTLSNRIDQWNVSPKLAASGEEPDKRLVPSALETFAALSQATFKFVITKDGELEEVEELISRFSLPKGRILLMPEARDKNELRERSPAVARLAGKAGFRFSSRLHLELYDGRRGT